jgi:hypothetical protein
MKAFERSRKVIRKSEELRAAWWAQVFKTLTPPNYEMPETEPTWVIDLALQQKVVDHWRSLPLASGS